MGDHRKVTPLWDANAKVPEAPLRRPNAPLRRPNNTSVNSSSIENLDDSILQSDMSSSFNNSLSFNEDGDIVSKSKLSVDAKEWFPRDYGKSNTVAAHSNNSSRSAQGRLLKIKMQPQSAPEINTEVNGDFALGESANDLSKLQVFIGTLIEDPGQYDDLIGSFIETLGPYYDDINMVSTTTNLIFNQAILEPNFRYNAARLCNTMQEQCSLFRSTLHVLCEQKLKEHSYDANFALFMAELYHQLNYDNFYGRHVIDTLTNVLSLGSETNVKSVCQALKLTGASLDSHNKEAINDIFKQLEIVKQVLQGSVVNLINSVISLRTLNWGQGQNSPVKTNRYNNDESHPLHDEPIFYGPDGKELTDEEREFLTDNCSYQSELFINDDSDPDALWDPDPEMDEEMQAAFQEFVRFSNRKT